MRSEQGLLWGVYVDAVVNGKKVELYGGVDKRQVALIVPGDYRAMLSKNTAPGGSGALFQDYDVLLPNRSVWSCEVTGLSE